MPIIHLNSLSHPGLEMFSTLTEAQLRNRLDPARGLFIAESPKVIRVALDAGYEPMALLCEERHIEGDAADIIARCNECFELKRKAEDGERKAGCGGNESEGDGGEKESEGFPVYTGSRELLASLTGYTLTRGVLCAMRRKPLPTVAEVCRDARRVVVMDSVVDSTNIGAIFRSAAALGIDGVLLTRGSCDPLNRRAIRVSMGSVFLVPWTWIDTPLGALRELGFRTVAMALTDNSIPLDAPALAAEPRLAIIMGTEGDGLPHQTIADADYVVRIPMAHGVDSLNVAAASAVAFWQLRA